MDEKISTKKQEEFESEQNLLGFFSILLQVDKRINPQNYQLINNNNYDRYNNINDSEK